ncbi:MAG: dihydrodipicolinate synthase family protein [Planctomycetaceae bacterium]
MPIRLISAPHTPFDSQGNLNCDVVSRQAQLLAANGVAGVFIGGSTGEYASLTVDERRQLAEAWVAAAQPVGLDVIVHVGSNAQSDAVELARHAGTLPVKAIASLAPCYFRPQSVDDLIDFFTPIAVATDLPFYFYDIPSMSGVSLSTVDFLRKGADRLPSLRGVKFTNADLAQFQECRHFDGGRFEILFGCDEHLLAGYALGATGAVGSTYNFAPGLYHQLAAAWDRGDADEARRLQFESVRLVRCLQSFGYMAAAKSVMSLCGVDCGPVRPPLRPLSSAQFTELQSQLQRQDLRACLIQKH